MMNKEQRPVSIVAIGAGNRTNKYLEYVRKTPDKARLIGVVELNDLRRQKVADEFDLDASCCYTDYRDFFRSPLKADAVMICTPENKHFEPAMLAIETGYHVLLEKPIAQTLEECMAIGEAARRKNVIVSVCHVLRYHPYFIKLKELGFNMIRKHIKVEPDRFYYLCDKYGMFVWQDMPNGGGDYDMLFVTELTNAYDWIARNVTDAWFMRDDEEGRKQYYVDLQAMIEELYNHPCIATWVPFNEGWGQFDANKATALIRSVDPTRFVNEACGWFDQHGGDMYSIHNYAPGLEITAQPDRVVALTEFGGYAFAMPGHLACEKEFGYQSYHSKEELTANYKRLWEAEIYPNVERGMCSTVYTQTSDIEEEINGIFTYDRDEVKLLEDDVKALNDKLYQVLAEKVTK